MPTLLAFFITSPLKPFHIYLVGLFQALHGEIPDHSRLSSQNTNDNDFLAPTTTSDLIESSLTVAAPSDWGWDNGLPDTDELLSQLKEECKEVGQSDQFRPSTCPTGVLERSGSWSKRTRKVGHNTPNHQCKSCLPRAAMQEAQLERQIRQVKMVREQNRLNRLLSAKREAKYKDQVRAVARSEKRAREAFKRSQKAAITETRRVFNLQRRVIKQERERRSLRSSLDRQRPRTVPIFSESSQSEAVHKDLENSHLKSRPTSSHSHAGWIAGTEVGGARRYNPRTRTIRRSSDRIVDEPDHDHMIRRKLVNLKTHLRSVEVQGPGTGADRPQLASKPILSTESSSQSFTHSHNSDNNSQDIYLSKSATNNTRMSQNDQEHVRNNSSGNLTSPEHEILQPDITVHVRELNPPEDNKQSNNEKHPFERANETETNELDELSLLRSVRQPVIRAKTRYLVNYLYISLSF